MSISLMDRDLKHIWHPCSQMKDYELFKPVAVKSAYGSYIELENGVKLIDAISSWWCKSLGHQHPRLKQAAIEQINQFEHVIFANTTNEIITLLSEELTNLTQSLKKIFYAGDGSSAIEIAMKMSLHARIVCGEVKKTRFIALENGYHGETMGALSVSDIGLYKKPYQSMLFDVNFISPIPYVLSTTESLWSDCHDYWMTIEKMLEPHVDQTTAIILEPIVQGAGGMKIYSQDFLQRLRIWTANHGIHLIVDEIMTGMGRTGKMFAYQYADIEPDFLCLAKGLTAGWMPFSAVLMRDEIYNVFYDDYEKGTSFLHSHTYSGHVIAARIALEVLKIIQETNLCEKAQSLGIIMKNAMNQVAFETKKISNVRQIGAIVAADLIHHDQKRRVGFEIYQKAVELGALLRPLGNTIYWMPPINSEQNVIEDLKEITQKALLSVDC